jgi:YfiH family protein
LLTSDIQEEEITGPVPRYEIPGWRQRFGVAAGITGRGNGSQPFDLGLWTSQPVGEVMSRWKALRAAEREFSSHLLGNQVHGSAVSWHNGMAPGWTQIEGVDGHATETAGLMLYVTVADCIPVYLINPSSGRVGLLHAGWRGTAAGILERGCERLVGPTGSSISDLVMHCGVGICGACYEVGSEVMEGLGLAPSGPGPHHADLRQVLLAQAKALGIREISISSWCSAHHHDRFFSHRASRGSDGRMVAYLGRTVGG